MYIISGGGVEDGCAVQEVAEDQVEVLGLVAGQEVDELVADEQVREEDADQVAQGGDEDLGRLVEVDRAYF
jgi:hypothetical protein